MHGRSGITGLNEAQKYQWATGHKQAVFTYRLQKSPIQNIPRHSIHPPTFKNWMSCNLRSHPR